MLLPCHEMVKFLVITLIRTMINIFEVLYTPFLGVMELSAVKYIKSGVSVYRRTSQLFRNTRLASEKCRVLCDNS